MRTRITQELVKRYLEDNCSPDEKAAIEKWLQNPESDTEILQMIKADWDQFDLQEETTRMDSTFFDDRFESLRPKLTVSKASKAAFRPWMKFAASAILIVFVTLLVSNVEWNSDEEWLTQYSNDGGPTIYMLSDGSRVTLSSGSSISYPVNMAKNNRRIVLTGEAFFDVPQNTQPLMIYAGNLSAKVSSSSLNISAFEEDEEVLVAVAKGQAEISENKELMPMLKLRMPQTLPLTKLLPPQSVRVENDEYFALNKTDGSIDMVDNFNPKEVFGWKDGVIYFNNADSAKVYKRLERWYGVDIKTSGCLTQNSFTGEFENKTLEDILTSMMNSPNIKYEISGKTVSIEGACI